MVDEAARDRTTLSVKNDEPDVGTADADAPGESSCSVESIVVNMMDENVVWLRRPTRADACATGV